MGFSFGGGFDLSHALHTLTVCSSLPSSFLSVGLNLRAFGEYAMYFQRELQALLLTGCISLYVSRMFEVEKERKASDLSIFYFCLFYFPRAVCTNNTPCSARWH